MNIHVGQVLGEGGVQQLGRAVSLAALQLRLLSTHPACRTASRTETAHCRRYRLVLGQYQRRINRLARYARA